MTKKKTVKKASAVSTQMNKLDDKNKCGVSCCEAKWNLTPLRIALGLLFLITGLIKIFSLFGPSNQMPTYFAALGIPAPLFVAWLVAIIEVLGGVSLILGLCTKWPSIALGIILLVATILTTLNPLKWINFAQHLVFITALIAVMYGNKYFAIKTCCGCKCNK
ncbi:MAG: DoxX family protein [Candidatus Woesearchaeota archaeon]|jgi:uncharacterized membrane protein YphA (DoxX/SURF4 family)